MLKLVLGGARSGKSRYAEQCAAESGKQVIYFATAQKHDAEMELRVQRHQQRRPEHWQTIEEPIKLAAALKQYGNVENCLLVDCLTLWLSNVLFDEQGGVQTDSYQQHKAELLETLGGLSADIILVSNEVGKGIVPMGAGTRCFVDEAGWLHQDIAKISQQVIFVTAGLTQVLK